MLYCPEECYVPAVKERSAILSVKMQLKPPGLKAMAEDRMEEKIKSTNILLFIFCKGEKI